MEKSRFFCHDVLLIQKKTNIPITFFLLSIVVCQCREEKNENKKKELLGIGFERYVRTVAEAVMMSQAILIQRQSARFFVIINTNNRY